MTGIGLKTQKPGGIHKPRIIFLIIAIFVLVTKKRTYPGDSFPSPGDLLLTPLVYATVNPGPSQDKRKGRGTLYHLSLWYLREQQVRPNLIKKTNCTHYNYIQTECFIKRLKQHQKAPEDMHKLSECIVKRTCRGRFRYLNLHQLLEVEND